MSECWAYRQMGAVISTSLLRLNVASEKHFLRFRCMTRNIIVQFVGNHETSCSLQMRLQYVLANWCHLVSNVELFYTKCDFALKTRKCFPIINRNTLAFENFIHRIPAANKQQWHNIMQFYNNNNICSLPGRPKRVNLFAACNVINIDQIYTNFCKNQADFILNMTSKSFRSIIVYIPSIDAI